MPASLTPLISLAQPADWLLVAITLVLAYTVFSLVGFGSALIASAPLAWIIPVARVIPLLALLDCTGSLTRGWRARQFVAKPELLRMLPGLLLGQLLGVFVLVKLPAAWMALLLGAFVLFQGVRGLWEARGETVPSPRALTTEGLAAAIRDFFRGLLGGVLGGLFGNGGFIYASYLQRRLASREAFRATQAVLIAISTAWRVTLCAMAGLVDGQLLATAVLLLPALMVGTYLGHHIDLRLSRRQLFLVLNLLLLASGAALVAKYLGSSMY
jgi:uncharacterized membrane protein YfcA